MDVVVADCCFFFCKQKTAYEVRISDWSSDVCSSDLREACLVVGARLGLGRLPDPSSDLRVATYLSRHGIHAEVQERQAEPSVEEALKIGRASCRERVCQYV